MKIGIMGTGMVGKTVAAKLAEGGNEVMVGTRNIDQTLASTKKDVAGNPPFSEWLKQHSSVRLGMYEEAARYGDLLVLAVAGTASLETMNMAGAANVNGKILIDVSNPLDFSKGMPPTLTVVNTDSIGEQVQRAYPAVKVVKTLNTTNAFMMIDPGKIGNGDHSMFVAGNDADARSQVAGYLKEWFGWSDVIDLGDISAARGMEMILPLWIRLMGVLRTATFNFKVVR